VDFSEDMRTKSASLLEPMNALTADLTRSTLLCAHLHEVEVTGKVSRKNYQFIEMFVYHTVST